MNFRQVEQARQRLREHLPVTRLRPAPSLTRATGAEVFLKFESELPTGSFKPRGALNALLVRQQHGAVAGVTASSTGNHGAAVAYAAQLLGIPSTIFLPKNPNPVKRARIDELNATIVEHGRDLSEATDRARQYTKEKRLYFLNDADDPEVPPGTATIACEILEQEPEVDTIIIPVGDTALIRGVAFAAKHLKPKIRIVGVQAERAPAYYLSWKKGQPAPTETCDTIADGLATRIPLEENVRTIRELVDDIVLVTEEEMLQAMRRLLLDEGAVAEPAGAAATAAFLKSKQSYQKNKVALLVTGSNLTQDHLRLAVRSKT